MARHLDGGAAAGHRGGGQRRQLPRRRRISPPAARRHPAQEDACVEAETRAIYQVFGEKRRRILSGLERLGIRTDRAPDGTFYVWGNLSALPPPLDDGMGFFRAALERKVICVPGEFFDVNPGKRRSRHGSRFEGYVRFSFGPALPVLETALGRLERMIAEAGR